MDAYASAPGFQDTHSESGNDLIKVRTRLARRERLRTWGRLHPDTSKLPWPESRLALAG